MTKEIAKKQDNLSTRFMNAVISEFGGKVGDIALTDFQKRLVQNYFMAIDGALSSAEERRQRASGKYQDKVPVTWANVNMQGLAQSVVSAARIGLDPAMPNHVYPIPFKDNKTNKYNINLMEGYRGRELKAVKYGLDVPDSVIVEVVYSNDFFKPIKKDRNNTYETYEFEISEPFKRGEIRGGFYYHAYADNPEKNKLGIMSLEDILKRRPDRASSEFWGGEKDVWKNGKKTGEKEKIAGWFDEMVYKTIYIAAYKDITIDSQKIDDDYLRLKSIEDSYADVQAQTVIDVHANSEVLDFGDDDIEDAVIVEPKPETEQEPAEPKAEPPLEPEPDPAQPDF